MPILSTHEPTVKGFLEEADGQPRYRAVCLFPDCDWSYENERGHLVLARIKGHCHETQHVVDLRLDILDLFVDRIEPAVKSAATGKAPTVSKRELAEAEEVMRRGCEQPMSNNPYSGENCGVPVFCVGCTCCSEHCGCTEPVTLAELTEGKENLK